MAYSRNKTRTRRLLLCIILSLCCLLDSFTVQAVSDPASEIILRVNGMRSLYGLPAYQIDSALSYAAQTQASWNAQNNHIGHDGPGGNSPNDRALAAGYGGGAPSFAVENTAHGTASMNTPELIVTMWQGDSAHLNAMISPDYEHIGVGYAEANDYSWYVMMVGWVEDESYSGDIQTREYLPYVPFVLSEPDEYGAIYHEVQPGQAAWTIAAQYGIDLAELLELNDLTEDSILFTGDILLIHPPDTPISTPTPQRLPEASPELPISTPLPPESTEVTPEPSAFNSQVLLILLVAGLGMALVVIIAIVSRSRKR